MKRVLLSLLYASYLALTLEAGLRFYFLPAVATRFGNAYTHGDADFFWRRRWMLRHSDHIQVYFTFDSYDPTLGWRPKPSLVDQKVFGDKFLNTNSRQLRGRTEYSFDKNPDKRRILILGDSFTFGEEVSDDETYSHHLQTLMPDTEVINMGVHGYGHDQMLLLLQKEGVLYHPDVVVLGFLTTDMERNLLLFRDYAKPRFLIADRGLELIGSPVPSPQEIARWDWLRPRIYDITAFVLKETLLELQLETVNMNEEAVSGAILSEMVSVIVGAHAVPVFVYLPQFIDVEQDDASSRGEVFLLDFCRSNGNVDCFSATTSLQGAPASEMKRLPKGHWPPAGHLAIARAIKAHLEERGLVGTQLLRAIRPEVADRRACRC